MITLLSFHNDPKIKSKYLERLRAHVEADELIKGVYWQDGKGCNVGCILHSSNHAAFETELGLPEWYARLIDTLFENLPNSKAKKFATQTLELVPVGVSLDKVKWQFCSFLMAENIERVNALLDISDGLKAEVVEAIQKCKAVQDEAIKTGVVDRSAESASAASASAASTSAASVSARSAWSARSAASAWSAAELVAAATSARSARSAASAAASAAESSARSAARSARSAACVRYADKLIELLKCA